MKKTRLRIIGLSAVFGVMVWVFNAILDYLIFYEDTFLGLLITNVPPHEVYMRTMLFASIVVFGFIISQVAVKHEAAQEEVSRAKEEWERTFDTVPDMVTIIDSNYRIVRVNKATADRLGIEPKKAVGRKCFELVHGTIEPPEKCPHGRMIETGKSQTTEYYDEKLGGYFHVSVSPLFDEKGKCVGCVHVANDITESKQAEEALRKSEYEYLDLYDNAPDMYVSVNAKTALIEKCNQTLVNNSGYTKEEIVGHPIFEIYHPDCMEEVKKTFKQFVEIGEVHDRELQLKRKDGSKLDVSLNVSSVRDEEGNILYSRSTWRDVTDRKRVEEQLADLAKFPSENPNPVLRISGDGVVLFGNESSGILLEAWGSQVGQCVPTQWCDIVADALASRESRRAEMKCDERTFSLTFTPVREAGYVNVYALDITERKLAEGEQEHLMNVLEAKNKEMQSIVYIASHDLRSPLVTLHGFSSELGYSCKKLEEVLAGEKISPAGRENLTSLLEKEIPESLKFIEAGTDKLEMLIDGLLRLSRVGSISIEIESLDMNKMVENIVDTMRFEIKTRGASVKVGDLPGCWGDTGQINQIFSNLLSNALKYLSPVRKGVIRISGRVEGAMSVYSVEDNGIGIAPDHQENIFEIFHRLRPEEKAGGEGLGLSIVRRILDRHNGKVWVESTEGQGATFYIAIPTA